MVVIQMNHFKIFAMNFANIVGMMYTTLTRPYKLEVIASKNLWHCNVKQQPRVQNQYEANYGYFVH